MSEAAYNFDTRFGKADDWNNRIREITGNEMIKTIVDAEPVGPKLNFDVIVVAPCTGNTVAKLANAITDTPVTMACKAQLRNIKPIVLAIATNDGLSANAKNIGTLLNAKNVPIFLAFALRPSFVAIAKNDGLSANAKNIGTLLNAKNVYFVPFGQDDFIGKPNSLEADFELIEQTIDKALQGKQVQPVLL